MKRFLSILLLFSISSCGFFKTSVKIDEVIKQKEIMDRSGNPAYKYLIRKELSDKRIELQNLLVKDIIISANIDYDFCVVADVDANGKKIECYIYSRALRTISRLEKGKSKINVTGEFGRFFTMLDEYYTKIDIVDASIQML